MKKLLFCLPVLGVLSACQSFCNHQDTPPPTEKKMIRDDIKANPQIITPNP